MDNEFERTRNLLRKSTVSPTPAGLEDRVLLSIAEAVDKKAKKRAALSGFPSVTAIGPVVDRRRAVVLSRKERSGPWSNPWDN